MIFELKQVSKRIVILTGLKELGAALKTKLLAKDYQVISLEQTELEERIKNMCFEFFQMARDIKVQEIVLINAIPTAAAPLMEIFCETLKNTPAKKTVINLSSKGDTHVEGLTQEIAKRQKEEIYPATLLSLRPGAMDTPELIETGSEQIISNLILKNPKPSAIYDIQDFRYSDEHGIFRIPFSM